MNPVPKWVVIYTVIAALMGLGFSVMFIGTEGIAYAARNATPAIASVAVLLLARKAPAGYLAAMFARATIELGDTINGLTGGSEVGILVFAIVMLVLDVAAIVVLFPKLKESD
jgi:hypothetical protein